METTVHERAHNFLNEKLESLQNQKEMWTKDYVEKEVQDREIEFKLLKEKRDAGSEELMILEGKRRTEVLEHKAKEDEMRNAVLIDKQRREQLQRNAVLIDKQRRE